ncbi:hypothetical protein ACQZV8_03605 [Magnetococcales bacterium HHB-1]
MVEGSNVDADVSAAGTLDADTWEVKQLWLETEVMGFGLKVGEMPIALNDDVFINQDTNSSGAIVVSKSFGDHTVLGAWVKAQESTVTNEQDDADLWVLSALGKVGKLEYQGTLAYLEAGYDSVLTQRGGSGTAPTGTQDTDNAWIAGTVKYAASPAFNITATAIYESGWNNYSDTTTITAGENNQQGDSGYSLSTRLNGKVGGVKWNAYGVYASENYSDIQQSGGGWSKTWDMGGPGASDLVSVWTGAQGAANNNTSDSENIWGVGAGVSFKAGKVTINPMLDFVSVVEPDITGDGNDEVKFEDAWGGSLALSTMLNNATSLSVSGHWLNPNESNLAGVTAQTIHFYQASLKMKF